MPERRKDSKKRVLKEGEYQRSNGTYEYKWRDAKGDRHSAYAKSLEELREKELDVLRDVLNGIEVEANSMTLNDLFSRWVQIKRGIKESTFNKYKHDYNRYIKPSLGGRKISKLKSSDIRAFYNELFEVMHFAVSTIGTIHRILYQILELGVDDDLLRKNPAAKALKDFKSDKEKTGPTRKAMTLAEQELFEGFLASSRQYSRWQPLFTVMLWTGMRAGEITGLRWCDVDFEHDIISIDHAIVYLGDEQLKNNRTIVSTPKTSASVRKIHMIPKVRDAFLREKKMQELMGIKCTVEINGYTDFVFLTRNGGPKHVWGLNDALDNIVKTCNHEITTRFEEGSEENSEPPLTLPPLSCHWLRHTFATRCCEADVSPKSLQQILGHADYQTSMDIYAEPTDDLGKTGIIRLNEHFGSADHLRLLQKAAGG